MAQLIKCTCGTFQTVVLLLQWHYSPYWTLASSTRCLHDSLSLVLVFQARVTSNMTSPYPVLFVIAIFVLRSFLLSEAYLEVSKQHLFTKWHQPHAQSPTWRARMSLVWVITFDPSGMVGPASRNATTGITPGIIWPQKPHNYVIVGLPLGGANSLDYVKRCEVFTPPFLRIQVVWDETWRVNNS